MKGLGEYADNQPIRVQHFENRLREMLRRKFIHGTVYRLAAQVKKLGTPKKEKRKKEIMKERNIHRF